MRSLFLVLIYQVSSGSGSSLAAGVIPRHGKAMRSPRVSSRLPSPLMVHVSRQTFPHWNLFSSPLGLSLQGFQRRFPSPDPRGGLVGLATFCASLGGKRESGVGK